MSVTNSDYRGDRCAAPPRHAPHVRAVRRHRVQVSWAVAVETKAMRRCRETTRLVSDPARSVAANGAPSCTLISQVRPGGRRHKAAGAEGKAPRPLTRLTSLRRSRSYDRGIVRAPRRRHRRRPATSRCSSAARGQANNALCTAGLQVEHVYRAIAVAVTGSNGFPSCDHDGSVSKLVSPGEFEPSGSIVKMSKPPRLTRTRSEPSGRPLNLAACP
jgi:hypothetical protein